MRTIDRALFVEQSGATIVSRGGRLYLRYRGEYDELDMTIRTVIASGMGFVITSDAMRACTKKHIEMIITDATQSFVAIYGFYVPGNASRSGMAARMRQFAALANPRKKLSIAKDIIRRKIVAEHRIRHEVFIADLEACTNGEILSCILQRGSTRQRNGDHSKLDISAGGKASPASCHDNLQRGDASTGFA